MSALTKAELAAAVQARTGLGRRACSDLIDEVFALMKESLQRGEPVKIAGFGNFVVSDKAERRGRNPRTGAELVIPAHRVVKLRYSTQIKAQLRPRKEEP